MSELFANSGPILGIAVIGILLGTGMLRAAYSLSYRLSRGGSSSVAPEMSSNKAVVVSSVAIFFAVGVWILLQIAGFTAHCGEGPAKGITVAVGFVATAGVVSGISHITVARGICIALLEFLLISAVLAAMTLAIAIVRGGRN